MPSSTPDPLFWPFIFVALIVAVFAVATVKVIALLVRRDPDPWDQRQHAGDRGSNTYDASSHSTTTSTSGT